MNNKLRNSLLAAGLLSVAVGFNSCKKVDGIVIPNKEVALFSDSKNTGAYFITDDANTVFYIPVGTTVVSNKDRNIQFSITSTSAVEGQQYTVANKTVTIPAGQAGDTIPLKGIFGGYPTGRKDTLTFKITGGDVPALAGSDAYKVILQKYCAVNLNDLLGTYADCYDKQTGEPDYGPYSIVIKSPEPNGTNKGKVVLENFWDVGTEITIELDWTDPANFKTNIPIQKLYDHPTYGPATITPVGNGVFSSCDKTFTFSYKVTVAAGSFGNFTTTLHL